MSDLQETQRALVGSPEKSSNMMRRDVAGNSNGKLTNSVHKDGLSKSIKERNTLGTKNSLSGVQRMSLNN